MGLAGNKGLRLVVDFVEEREGRVYDARFSGVGDLRFLKSRERVKEAGIVKEFLRPRIREGESSNSLSLSSSTPLNGASIEKYLQVCSVYDLVVGLVDVVADALPAFIGLKGLDVKACFVGVGGRSNSLLDWLSCLPTGDRELSSPSTLRKLPRRWALPFTRLLPKMLTP